MRQVMMAALGMLLASPAAAQDAEARYGPVFAEYGPHYPVEGISEVPAETRFAHSFDVAARAEGTARNRGFESAARFLNMHAAAGVPADRMQVAVVVHGGAVLDLLTDEARVAGGFGETNPSGAMVRAMLDAGVRFIVCGQSATGSGVAQADLIEGVETALSAMTAHALLQQAGYTVNPF